MNSLKAVIIDDEPDSVSLLQLQLQRHCKSIRQITTFTNPLDALRDIPTLNPDIVFVDIEMPILSGFELLDQLLPLKFNVIFVTAFNQYAIRAFRFNALDYLLKPAEVKDLKEAVTKAEKQAYPQKSQLSYASYQLRGNQVDRIALPGQNGITFVDLDDILFVESKDNYSKLVFKNGSSHTLSKTLKDLQEILEESHFHRVHRQYIVNLNCVKHFNKNEGLLTLDNKEQLPIVRNQYERFMEKYYRP